MQRSYAAPCRPVHELTGKLAVALMEEVGRSGRRLVGVTGSADGNGASLIAGQLAKVIAETGWTTCLVDANWRLPSLGSDARPTCPDGKLERSTEVLRSHNVELTVMLLRGTIAVSDLVASRSVLSALEEASALYDWVVVDLHSPARTMDLEAAIGLLDQVIVVVEACRSTAKTLQEVLAIVPHLKRAAVILNKAPGRLTRKAAARASGMSASGQAYDTAASF